MATKTRDCSDCRYVAWKYCAHPQRLFKECLGSKNRKHWQPVLPKELPPKYKKMLSDHLASGHPGLLAQESGT